MVMQRATTQSLICNVTMIVVAKVIGAKSRARSRFHNEFTRTSVVRGRDDHGLMKTTTLVLCSQSNLLPWLDSD